MTQASPLSWAHASLAASSSRCRLQDSASWLELEDEEVGEGSALTVGDGGKKALLEVERVKSSEVVGDRDATDSASEADCFSASMSTVNLMASDAARVRR